MKKDQNKEINVLLLILCFLFPALCAAGQDINKAQLINIITNWEKNREKYIYRLITSENKNEITKTLKTRTYEGNMLLAIPDLGNKGKNVYLIDNNTGNVIKKRKWEKCKNIYKIEPLEQKKSLIAWNKNGETGILLSVVNNQGEKLTTKTLKNIKHLHEFFIENKKIFLVYSPFQSEAPQCLKIKVFKLPKIEKGRLDLGIPIVDKTLTHNFVSGNRTEPAIIFVNGKVIGLWLKYIKAENEKIKWNACIAVVMAFRFNESDNELSYLGEKNLKKYRFPHYGTPPVKFDIDVPKNTQRKNIIKLSYVIKKDYRTGEAGTTVKRENKDLYQGTINKLIRSLKSLEGKRNGDKTSSKRNTKNNDKLRDKLREKARRQHQLREKARRQHQKQVERFIEQVKEIRGKEKQDGGN